MKARDVKEIRQKPKWTVKISVWKDYKADNEETDMKCFEEDWKNCKLKGAIKDHEELEATKEVVRKNYRA